MRGRPLQELVDGTAQDWPEEVFVQISESEVGRAIRTKRWKYSVVAKDLSGSIVGSSNCYTENFLYDLEKDYYEQNNLIHDENYEGVRKELADILKKHMAMASEEVPEILPYR